MYESAGGGELNLGPFETRPRPSFNQSVFKLLGHVLGGAALLLGLAAVSWAIGWGVHAMNAIHPFNPSVLSLLHWVEEAVLYLDIALSGMVLLIGAGRFVKELAR
jgi:hypothetical protein